MSDTVITDSHGRVVPTYGAYTMEFVHMHHDEIAACAGDTPRDALDLVWADLGWYEVLNCPYIVVELEEPISEEE